MTAGMLAADVLAGGASPLRAAPPGEMEPEEARDRIAATLERMNAALTPEMLREIKTLPEKQRTRLVKAVGELSSKAAGLI